MASPKPTPAIVVTRQQRLTSPSNIRKFMLEYAAANRAHPFRQVAKSKLDEAEAVLRNWCIAQVKAQPSMGVTIK